MFNPRKILRFPLRTVEHLSDTIYAKSPEKMETGFKVAERYYRENKEVMESRGIEHLGIRTGLHNDPRDPDPKGPHFTVRCMDENGVVVTVKHIYPNGDELVVFQKID